MVTDLDHSGLIGHGLGFLNGSTDLIVTSVTVLHPNDVPPKRFKTFVNVLGEGDLGVTVNGDVVVIIESNQLSKSPMAGKRTCFVCNSFHLATISKNTVSKAKPANVIVVKISLKLLNSHKEI
ncbi:hypothetical protein Hanom_Chr06g00490201 [Helianthus anomalus]